MPLRLAQFILAAALLGLTGCGVSRPATPKDMPASPALLAPAQDALKNSWGMEFIRVPAGSFNMGSPAAEIGRDQDERLHEVRLSRDFYLQRTEVTQGQWRAVMGDNPAFFLNCGDECPVEQVSWNDVQLFLSRLNQLDRNFNYRLPSEAEWEYAARAGSLSALPSGDLQGAEGEALFHDPNLDPIGWYVGNSDQGTHPVGEKQANAWGFYDMHGNVQEWVSDWHNTYPFNAVIDPAGPEQGRTKLRRGGSWNLYARLCRSASRDWASPSLFDPFTGLRLVAFAVPPEPATVAERKLPSPATTPVTSWEIFFELDSAELSPAMNARLADIVRALADTDDQLLLTGHTCDLAPDDYNQKLSEQRVSTVKDYFLRHGIAQHRISTQALGEHQPAYPNDSEDGRKLNRRVVIHLK